MRVPTLFVRHPFIAPYWLNGEVFAALRALTGGASDAPRRVAARMGAELQREAVAVGSGRLALELALRGVGVRPGDEVIVPSFGCGALVAAVRAAGATPAFADVRADLNIDPDSVDRLLAPQVRAVVVVHAGGKRADVGAILALAEPRGIPVVEDCAQATGGRTGGRAWGIDGSSAVFSFGPGKNLMATGGGLVAGPIGEIPLKPPARADDVARLAAFLVRYRAARLTRPFLIALDLFRLRGAPEDRADDYPRTSMSPMDAAIALRQLDATGEIIGERTRNALALISELSGSPGVIPPSAPEHVFTKFYVTLARVTASSHARAPEIHRLVRGLLRAGFEPELAYLPLHRRFSQAGRNVGCPMTDDLAYRTLTLPVRPGIEEPEIRRMAAIVRAHA